jgi:single-strand DNA-binding protein
MVSVNTVILGGHLGADPEERRTSGGKLVCSFRLATNRWDTKTQADVADWHTVLAWEKQAENCMKYLKKGAAVLVEGRILVSRWEDADGKKQSKHEISASRVTFLGQPRGSSEWRAGAEVERAAPAAERVGAAEPRTTRGVGPGFADAIPF